MQGFKTGTHVFYDHLGRPHELPPGAKVGWRPSVYALVTRGNNILMVEPECAPGTWTLPGGGVEPSESLLDGLRRECQEELGFRPVFKDGAPLFLGENAFYFQWTFEYFHSLVIVYAAQLPHELAETPLPLPPDPTEILRVAWIDPLDLDEEECHFTHRSLIRTLR